MEIRNLKIADSSAFLALLIKLDNETKFMMLEPGERDMSLENMQRRLSNIDETILGVYDNEDLIGFISLLRRNANRAKHSAYIVIGILSSHTGKGIGKRLFMEGEKWAIRHNVTRLELTVMVHNINAIKLYEKVGFIKEGIKKNSLFIDEKYIDEYYMGKLL